MSNRQMVYYNIDGTASDPPKRNPIPVQTGRKYDPQAIWHARGMFFGGIYYHQDFNHSHHFQLSPGWVFGNFGTCYGVFAI